MISIKNKLRIPQAPAASPTPSHEELSPTFKVTAYLPENPPVVGHEFNLIRIVEEHGPRRIVTIEKEIAQLTERIEKLTKEKNQITALVATLGAP